MAKNLKSVVTALAPMAAEEPTQHVRKRSTAPVSQLSLTVRRELHRELVAKAVAADVPLRVFVLQSLQQTCGLNVLPEDLIDARRERA